MNKEIKVWLKKLNNKTVKKIYQVDFNNERKEDIYLPWIFFIKFKDFDKFIEIEGDLDGSHLKINLFQEEKFKTKLARNHFPSESDLWQVYEVQPDEPIGELLGKKIDFIEFGIDKDEFEINGTKINGQKQYVTFIRFICGDLDLTIFEGSATGLGVSTNREIKINFEETFEIFKTN